VTGVDFGKDQIIQLSFAIYNEKGYLVRVDAQSQNFEPTRARITFNLKATNIK
jgi:hypothetical protein